MKLDGLKVSTGDRILVKEPFSFWESILIFLRLKKKTSNGIYTMTSSVTFDANQKQSRAGSFDFKFKTIPKNHGDK